MRAWESETYALWDRNAADFDARAVDLPGYGNRTGRMHAQRLLEDSMKVWKR